MSEDSQIIIVTKEDSRDVGCCNACTSHTDVERVTVKPHKVFTIRLRGIVVRVCRKCRDELLRQLKAVK